MAQSKKQSAIAGLKYRKEELIRSEQFKTFPDLINALLEPDQEYTREEAENKINRFLKGKVK